MTRAPGTNVNQQGQPRGEVAKWKRSSRHGEKDLRAGERVRGHVHVARATAAQPRRSGALPVPPGRVVGPVEQRVPRERRAAVPRCRQPPEYATPECDSIYDLVVHDKAGERILESLGAERGATAPRRRHPRRGLPLQEQHRLRGQLLRLPRELPRRAGRRFLEVHRRVDPVSRQPPDLRRRGQGPADRTGRDVLHRAARRAHLGGRVVGHHPVAADHQHAATNPTPTPSASVVSTSSSATPT